MKAITFSMGNRLCNLRVSRQEACTKISERIEKGNALLKSAQRLKERVFRTSRPGREPDDEHREKHDSLWSDYSRWGDFNRDLLNRLFDSPEIATEYSIPREPEATYGVLVAEIEEFENELKDDLQRLRSVKERLPLFEEVQQSAKVQKIVDATDGIVFVVHGRNEAVLAQTELLIQTLDLKKIVLRDQ